MKWLKKWLREWLADDSLPKTLKIKLGDSFSDVVPERAIGMGLLVQGSRGPRVITEAQAVDKEQFWKIWEHFSADRDVRWEDGTKYKPPGRR